jgi:hypothetical protein
MITQSGSAAIGQLLASGAVRLGVGVGSGTHPDSHLHSALAADGILGSCWYRGADVTFPAVQPDGSLLVQATFGHREGNFLWREWCLIMADTEIRPHHELAQAAPGAVLLSRRLPAAPLHGDPKSGGFWILRVPFRFRSPD